MDKWQYRRMVGTITYAIPHYSRVEREKMLFASTWYRSTVNERPLVDMLRLPPLSTLEIETNDAVQVLDDDAPQKPVYFNCANVSLCSTAPNILKIL
jgi:hypothetical protein